MGTPKILLFTDKEKGFPLVLKALSEHFEKTLDFGLVRSSETALAKKYKVKKYPSLLILKGKDTKPIFYDSEDYSYAEVFKFINVYSETFVFPGEQEVKDTKAAKPWLQEKVPEIHGKSANDVCLKKDGALCVIYAVKSAAEKEQAMLDMLYEVGGSFQKQIHRGINFHFMWLDCGAENELCSTLEIDTFPQVMIMNPGKRKRTLKHEGELNAESISATLDRIIGGDARFKMVPGNKLPEWAVRE